MWETIWNVVKTALSGAFSSRNNSARYKVKFKKYLADGKFETTDGVVTSASVEATGCKFGLQLGTQPYVLEAKPGVQHAAVSLDGTAQPDARLANPRVHLGNFPSFKILIDYPFRPVELQDGKYRIEVLYR